MVVDLVAVADILTGLRAEVPDRLLNLPRKDGWKGRVELPRINLCATCSMISAQPPGR
jgi:hypothetical protein